MIRGCEALVISRDGAARHVSLDPSAIAVRLDGRTVWAVWPGRGSEIGGIVVEEVPGGRGYEVLVDGTMVARYGGVEKALSTARSIEASGHLADSMVQ